MELLDDGLKLDDQDDDTCQFKPDEENASVRVCDIVRGNGLFTEIGHESCLLVPADLETGVPEPEEAPLSPQPLL